MRAGCFKVEAEDKVKKRNLDFKSKEKVKYDKIWIWFGSDWAGIYFFKVNNGNTRATFKICSKLTLSTSKRPLSGVFIGNLTGVKFTVKR